MLLWQHQSLESWHRTSVPSGLEIQSTALLALSMKTQIVAGPKSPVADHEPRQLWQYLLKRFPRQDCGPETTAVAPTQRYVSTERVERVQPRLGLGPLRKCNGALSAFAEAGCLQLPDGRQKLAQLGLQFRAAFLVLPQ